MGGSSRESSPQCVPPGYSGRGGRLRHLLLYDTLIFASIAAAALFHIHQEGWIIPLTQRSRETLFWARSLYGLAAIVFMPFLLPGLGTLLTHAEKTAYNKWGQTRPMLGAQARAKKATERKQKAEISREKWLLLFRAARGQGDVPHKETESRTAVRPVDRA